MFRGVRLLIWFDILVIVAGQRLLFDNWLPLTGSNLVATVVNAEPRCVYTLYIHRPKRGHYYERPPAVSGQCVETEKEALLLLNAGYNHVSKYWNVTATLGAIKREIKFRTKVINEIVYKENWKWFFWGMKKLEQGDKIYVLRSLTGLTTIDRREPQRTPDKVLPLYNVILGVLLCFGTLAIHAVPYLQRQNRKNV
jgi:hypothetical protein